MNRYLKISDKLGHGEIMVRVSLEVGCSVVLIVVVAVVLIV